MRSIPKPAPEEYPAYSHIYLDLMADDGRVLDHMWDNFLSIKALASSLSEEQLQYRYAEGKWTIKEILVHLIDDERIYTYRALRFARNDQTDLPGFDQEHYARFSDANQRSIESILEEYEAVRQATLQMYEYLPEEALMRGGTADGPEHYRSVRAFIYHLAGHELRHLNIIKEKYLSN
ncbi:MAG: DinB family protein [Saprospiraceae bacterium]|nr:DinB family protein [Saprospiraceae bacterium]